MVRLVDANANLYSYAGPGHWNDPDMMEVGHGLNDTEGQAHFSMRAILAAPLIAGNDLRNMSAATKATLTNSGTHSDLGTFRGSYTAWSVPGHGVVMLKVTSQ